MKNNLNMEDLITMSYSNEYSVATFQTDKNLFLRFDNLFQWLSETAWQHVREYGLNYEEFTESKRHWSLIGYNIRINKAPKWQDEFVMQTWHRGLSGVQYFRDFRLFSKDNPDYCFVEATSSWIVYDLKLNKVVVEDTICGVDLTIEYPKAHEEGFVKLRPYKNLDFVKTLKTQYTDIDLHNHVNNAVYFRWIEDVLQEKIAFDKVRNIKIQYLVEVREGETISIFMNQIDKLCFIELKNDKDVVCVRSEIELL